LKNLVFLGSMLLTWTVPLVACQGTYRQ